jgi:hypothetical protein
MHINVFNSQQKSSPTLSLSGCHFCKIVKSINKSFNPFHFGFAAAVSMILKTDQATSDSFSAYCQIAVHMICSFSRNFYCTRYKDDLLSQSS